MCNFIMNNNMQSILWRVNNVKDQMAPSSPQFTGNQHIQINIYIVTVTTALPTNTAFTTLSHTGPSKTGKPTHPNSSLQMQLSDWVFHRFQAKLQFQLSQKQWHNNTNSHRNNNRNHNIFVVVQYSWLTSKVPTQWMNSW